ncbi:MAG: hypothetical protein ACPG8W_26280 [Candidatus Promineifilaceae bacterium]
MSLLVPSLIGLHLSAALASMILGIMAMRNNQTPKAHKRVGILYVFAMTGVCVTGGILLVVRFNFFLMLVTVLSAQSFITGMRAARRKSRGTISRFDWSVTAIAGVMAVAFLSYGVAGLMGLVAVDFPPAYLYVGIGFALFIGNGVREDIRFFRNPSSDRRAWLYFHIDRMLGSYIALVVAMSVTVSRYTLPPEIQWVAWTVPPIIGGLLSSRYLKNYKARFAKPTTMRG